MDNGFYNDDGGFGLQDSPFMILIAVIIIAFVAVLGMHIISNFMDVQRHANAVAAAEKIYNTANMLSLGASGSSRTIWVKIPDGYEIDFNGNITLRDDEGVVGVPLHINGINIMGEALSGGEKHHLKLGFYVKDSNSTVTVSVIT